MAQLSDDCFAFGSSLLPIEAARAMILERVGVVAGREVVGLREAAGRTLAEDIVAGLAIPGFTNSAVDGYAVRFDDLDPAAETTLRLVDRIPAGHRPGAAVVPGSTARIFTGAILPDGYDTVIMQEDCRAEGDLVAIRPGIKRGANRRLAGEDVAKGAVALRAGKRLGPSDIGLIAALGRTEVPVRRRLAAALFSTGDEVREPGDELGPGQIYDANRFMIAACLERLGVAVTDRAIVADRPALLTEALTDAAEHHDLIVTSGGVSTGDEDHVRAAVAGRGSLFFWRLAIKPGRPVAVGQIGDVPVIGLPGNPVAALITFTAVARPLIEALSGTTPAIPRRFRVVSGFSYKKKAGRREYVRASLERGEGSLSRACRFPKEGAGMLTSLTETDGLVELAEELTELAAGAEVDFIPYSELM
jgi:molybdopterin molybdotransferase